jgi:acetolactate synthase small subunit
MSSTLSAAALAVADGDPRPVFVSFSVQARAEPGIMPRVVELFAKRGLVPHKWHSTVSGTVLTIEVQIAGLGRDPADYIARCMRQIHGVEAVLTSATRAAG